jgi:glyoxylase-like metal-dependent hydrolase (beta-lactamase superfamily II)
MLLPPQIHVFIRDWLSSNNILLKSPDGNVLIDTGYVRHAPLTLALLRSQRGLGDEPLARIVNTHCHSDHIGGNATIQRAYGCRIALPEGEAPLIERWDHESAVAGLCRSAERSLRCGRDRARWLHARLGRSRVASNGGPWP